MIQSIVEVQNFTFPHLNNFAHCAINKIQSDFMQCVNKTNNQYVPIAKIIRIEKENLIKKDAELNAKFNLLNNELDTPYLIPHKELIVELRQKRPTSFENTRNNNQKFELLNSIETGLDNIFTKMNAYWHQEVLTLQVKINDLRSSVLEEDQATYMNLIII